MKISYLFKNLAKKINDNLTTAEAYSDGNLQTAKNYTDTTFNTLADYVVEQGTSGIWTYRKWASGIAECWGMHSGALPAQTAWGSTYGSATNAVPTLNYPASFFIETPILTYGIGSNDGNYTLVTDDTRQPSKTRTTGFSLWRGTSYSSVNYVIYYHAIGKWK